MKKQISWSVSKIHTYLGCPLKYKKKYIMGQYKPSGPAAERGTMIHAYAENYLSGKIRGLPDQLKMLKTHYQNLKKAKPLVELKLATDENWKPTTWKKGWARGIVDVINRDEESLVVIDHKTGRVYDAHAEGAEIYACLALSTAEDVDAVDVEYWYVDQGFTRQWSWTADEILDLREKWKEEAQRMLTATKFPATPSTKACRWCDYRSDKRGGTCHKWKKVTL